MLRDSAYFLRRDALAGLLDRLPGTAEAGAGLHRQLGQLDAALTAAGNPPAHRMVPALFDLVSLAVCVVGESGRVLDANDATARMLGYERVELVGTHTAELVLRGDSTTELVGPHVPSGQQRVLTHAEGHAVACEIHTAPSLQPDGTRLWLLVLVDITAHHHHIQQLRYQATHDALTGLPNRKGLRELIGEHVEHAPPTGFTVLFCDIDNFKRVNDSWGHPAGDELLIAVAHLLQQTLPPECRLARFSGDEFLIVCPDVTAVGGTDALATRVAGILRSTLPIQGHSISVSGSVGAATVDGAARTVQDLVRFADAAMFDAKSRGAGRTALANTSLIDSANRQLDLEDQLRRALAYDGLILHYQSIVTDDGTVLGAEALLRWPHPERGTLGPDVILPVVEQGNLQNQLDQWVLRTALAEALHWPQSIQIAVNLSGVPSDAPELLNTLAAIIADSGIDPRRVILELTETTLLDLGPRERRAMSELTGRGVAFAIDDFGTGYSSLARLQDLPAQIVKLDRTFLPTSEEDTTAHAITRAVVDLCRATGHRCIAEGVETPGQLQLLNSFGIEAYQGWLFSHPQPAPAFRAALRAASMACKAVSQVGTPS